MSGFEIPFVRDSRGSALAGWDEVSSSGGRHVLRLRGPDEVVVQLLASGAGYRLLTGFRGQPAWTHAVRADGPLNESTRVLLDLLGRVVSLPVVDPLDFAVALDWYKIPDPTLMPREWPNTEIGELVHRGKYWYQHDGRRQRRAGRSLVSRICETVARHSALRVVDLVAGVPGHDPSRVSFGSRLAYSVATAQGSTWLPILARGGFRPEAKDMTPSERKHVLRRAFRCDRSLSGESVLLIDDVYWSGSSMRETARAVKEAGASAVYGLAAVRTLRRS